MRLWSFHPQYLDKAGLVALWREALLAQKVLQGKTRGYKNHPQLIRFQKSKNPINLIANYLNIIFQEAQIRNYKFNKRKISRSSKNITKIKISDGQIKYEWSHFLNKIKKRTSSVYQKNKKIKILKINPVFSLIKGKIAEWEKIKK